MRKITLTVCELNPLIKRQRLLGWILKRKKKTTLSCLRETNFKYKYTDGLKAKWWK